MTDLIQRDAAAAICDKHSYSNNLYVSKRMAEAAAEIRAIPAIDPAAIREAALREAAAVIGDQYRKAMALSDRDLTHDGKSYAAAAYGWSEQAILALIGEKK